MALEEQNCFVALGAAVLSCGCGRCTVEQAQELNNSEGLPHCAANHSNVLWWLSALPSPKQGNARPLLHQVMLGGKLNSDVIRKEVVQSKEIILPIGPIFITSLLLKVILNVTCFQYHCVLWHSV